LFVEFYPGVWTDYVSEPLDKNPYPFSEWILENADSFRINPLSDSKKRQNQRVLTP